ncbi:leucine-rich repeat-containing protein 42-like [Penaeus monodon]|uniref:leucine-rich repeat-containing protein 42-like n=1 Tax=Penaeus monodon TaxID=6687 RepID=UPI0018A7310A|nr:leucine-rich repeat-containing protein 42-like [Penaeus monodon]
MQNEDKDFLSLLSTREFPKTLFEICLDYVAGKINMVESLEGFPEVVSEQIFDKCLSLGSFSQNDEASERAITLYVDAYGNDFMSAFKCENPRIMSEYGECLAVLCLSVTHLDLRGCALGNKSDFLKVFVQMDHLRVLNIAQNELSDEGFRLMTACHKMYRKGFEALESLDVSENRVGMKVLKSLLSLPQLKNIRVSIAHSLKNFQPRFTHEWTETMDRLGFKLLPRDIEFAGHITTVGWGSKIIAAWLKEIEELERIRQEKVLKKSQGFYSQSIKRAELAFTKPRTRIETYETYTYMKRRKENAVSSPGEKCNSRECDKVYGNRFNSKKRTIGSIKSLQVDGEPLGKKQRVDIDVDILKMYLK